MPRWLRKVAVAGGALLCGVYSITGVSAESLQSPSYRFDESSIGAGGLLQSSSANFEGRSVIGDLNVGGAGSANFQIETGSETTDDPALSFTIIDSNPDLGDFSASGPATATATFSVSNYTSYGYVVQIVGTPPTNGSHTIDPMTTTGPSQFGIEQFGINLVANGSPVTFGADPQYSIFGLGSAAPNYGTPNEFRFVNGETIAVATASSGVTTYTISYLVNVSSVTPGGKYTSGQTLIVTGTY